MSNHSPAPWHFSADLGSQHGCRLIHAKDGHLVADAGRIRYRNSEEMDANARLIAAAPELLALLQESMEWIGGDWRARRDAAVAKATGGNHETAA